MPDSNIWANKTQQFQFNSNVLIEAGMMDELVHNHRAPAMPSNFLLENLPDARDGLNKKERIILYVLQQTQEEMRDRNVPTIMLYGRVLEHIDISEEEFQSILSRFTGLTKLD